MHLSRRIFVLPGVALACLVSTRMPAQSAAGEWPMYRADIYRSGNQSATGSMASLGDPVKAQGLHVVWQFPTSTLPGPPVGAFSASPIVSNGTAYIGNANGEFYAVDVQTGKLKWLFPNPAQAYSGFPTKPLIGTCSPYGNYGIQASAALDSIRNEPAVIFAAPDPDPQTDNGRGSARVWALDANTGRPIWKSDVIARVSGCTSGAFPGVAPSGGLPPEYHEIANHSSPLILHSLPGQPVGGTIYVGIQSHEDPIQLGSVRAVNLLTGQFSMNGTYFRAAYSSSTPIPAQQVIGGDVWNAPASDGTGTAFYFTTGNTRQWEMPAGMTPASYTTEPPINYGLSLVRANLDGSVKWFFQPVPFNLDNDPDWNAGATYMKASCGKLLVSVMKDGWSYAVDADTGSCVWQFPDMGNPGCKFPANDNHYHGPTGFRVPGATWNDVLVIGTGGYALPADGPAALSTIASLYALDVCENDYDSSNPHVRWLLSPVPNTNVAVNQTAIPHPVGAPTIINGLIYLATDLGHVMVFADPAVVSSSTRVCENTDYSIVGCLLTGEELVPVPTLLADVSLCGDACNAARFRKEVVLAEGFAFVGTSDGHLYALAPGANLASAGRQPPSGSQ
jgi:outer membrane protein assembly factor BamB